MSTSTSTSTSTSMPRNKLWYEEQLATLEVKTDYPKLPKISYVSLPRGMHIYRGGEKKHDTRYFPAYYSACEIADKYDRGSSINEYKARRQLFFMVPSFELFKHLQNINIGVPSNISGENYTIISALYAILYGDKRMDPYFVKNSAWYLIDKQLEELTPIVNYYNPGTLSKEAIREQLYLYTRLFDGKSKDMIVPSRTSLRIFDKTLVGLMQSEFGHHFDGIVHINHEYTHKSLCKHMNAIISRGDTCVPIEIAVFNGNDSLIPTRARLRYEDFRQTSSSSSSSSSSNARASDSGSGSAGAGSARAGAGAVGAGSS